MSESDIKAQLVWVYGTLKRGAPNHYLMQECRAAYQGSITTQHAYPMVVTGKRQVPYLLQYQDQGQAVKGELYLVDQEGADTLDKFEGVHTGYYVRRKVPFNLETLCDVPPEVNRQSLSQHLTLHGCSCYFLKDKRPDLLKCTLLSEYTEEHQKGYVSRFVMYKDFIEQGKELPKEPELVT